MESSKRRLKRSRTNYHFPIFSWEEEGENTKEHFSRTNKQEKHFFKETVQMETIQKTWRLVNKESMWKENFKKKKRNTMIKPNRVFKKMRHIKREWQRTKHSKLKKKNVQKHMRIKRFFFWKNKQTAKGNRQTSFFCFATVPQTCLWERLWTEDKGKRETNVLETRKTKRKKRDNRWTKSMSKRTYRGNARIQKRDKLNIMWYTGRWNCVKKNW